MKVVAFVFVALMFMASAAFSQSHTSRFERASLTRSGDGKACVQLNWTKGAENTLYYLVERSANGKDFRQVALVFSAEDEKVSTYKYRDKDFAGSVNPALYYRIAVVNEQKELTYLPVKKVDVLDAN